MRVQILDPSAFTPPYDHALCAALARAGAEVELVTSRFLYGPVPREEGYEVTELFYRRTAKRGLEAPARRAVKLAEHLPDMRRFRRHSKRRSPDIVHWQWVSVPALDSASLSRRRPGPKRVFTVHYPLPDDPRELRREYSLLKAMDAVVIHSVHGARRLREDVGLDASKVHVIEHGAFDYLTRLDDEKPLPSELDGAEGPVILFFGLLRPYKGLDVLLEAFRSVRDAELWVVGREMMPLEPLQALAEKAPGTVRMLPRFITDPEIPALFRRADIVVLPYREIEQSGVLYTAIAFGKAIVLSSVGGFTEVAERHGAGRLVPPGDAQALADTLNDLLENPAERDRLAAQAAQAAAGPFSWDRIAAQTLALYESLLDA